VLLLRYLEDVNSFLPLIEYEERNVDKVLRRRAEDKGMGERN
jgi:hypothetical protein